MLKEKLRIVYWGTYDIGKPRNRILIRGLRENDVEVTECHANVWGGVEDKSQILGWKNKCKFLLKWFLSYPGLIFRYLKLNRHDLVIVGYLGHLDVLVIWPFAKLRKTPLVWDAFLSLYDTIVWDRRAIRPRNPIAFLLFYWEWLSCRAADLVILDTQSHADYFRRTFKLIHNHVGVAFVGAETDFFPSSLRKMVAYENNNIVNNPTILFYGQFIPLHGVETIIQAAIRLREESVRWVMIGQGQEANKIRSMLSTVSLPKLKWETWVHYEQLIEYIHQADICLGIFGASEKAGRVIPNKVYQILSAGKFLITRDSPAIREIFPTFAPGVVLVPPANPHALTRNILYLLRKTSYRNERFHQYLTKQIKPNAVAAMLLGEIIKNLHLKLKR